MSRHSEYFIIDELFTNPSVMHYSLCLLESGVDLKNIKESDARLSIAYELGMSEEQEETFFSCFSRLIMRGMTIQHVQAAFKKYYDYVEGTL